MRKSELEKRPELTKQFTELLSAGTPIEDCCGRLGIAPATFHNWRKRGRVEVTRREMYHGGDDSHLSKKETLKRESEQLFVEFLETTTRAEADAKIFAVVVLRGGMMPTEVVTETVDTFQETRLDGEGKPYTYTRTTTKKSVTKNPADWRAALEYLKRRDKNNWSDRSEVTGADGSPINPPITDDQYARSMSTLADALRTILSGSVPSGNGPVDPGFVSPVDGVSDEG